LDGLNLEIVVGACCQSEKAQPLEIEVTAEERVGEVRVTPSSTHLVSCALIFGRLAARPDKIAS
jgi:hypothetical protein